jgi:hypothetical protein
VEEAPSWYLLLHTTGEIIMAQTQDAVTTWPELAEGLYAFLTGRGATIEYSFNQMTVMVPRDTGSDAPQARWQLDGTLRVRTSERGQPEQ